MIYITIFGFFPSVPRFMLINFQFHDYAYFMRALISKRCYISHSFLLLIIFHLAEFHEFKLQSLVRHSFDLAAQEKQNHELDEISTQVCPQFPTYLFSCFLFSSPIISSLPLI